MGSWGRAHVQGAGPRVRAIGRDTRVFRREESHSGQRSLRRAGSRRLRVGGAADREGVAFRAVQWAGSQVLSGRAQASRGRAGSLARRSFTCRGGALSLEGGARARAGWAGPARHRGTMALAAG